MAHEVETMAYRKEGGIPWHWGGRPVENGMTVDEMMNKSGTNWKVHKRPIYTSLEDGPEITIPDRNALIRSTDSAVLDIVGGDDWHTTQNAEAFAFFKEYVERGEMEMETAGSLRGGRIVWVLAKIKESFELFGGDKIQGFLLFSNYHQYGTSRDVRFTPIRVVCSNTLTAALSGRADKVFRATHRIKITNEMIQDTLGMAHKNLGQYKELAQFLGSREYNDDTLIEFFSEVFPSNSVKGEASRNAMKALDLVHTQPGAEFARNSWWQAVNAVTRMTDHELGRDGDTRTFNSLYGPTRDLKIKAFKIAKAFAEATT